MRLLLVGLLFSINASASAETIAVKNCGDVDLLLFKCDVTASSFVHRVCYDNKYKYLITQLKVVNNMYCDVDARIYEDFLKADDKEKFFNASLKGKFACNAYNAPICPRWTLPRWMIR